MTAAEASDRDETQLSFGSRITARLDELAACTDEPGRITRPYLGPAHRKACDLVSGWMAAAGMSPRIDAIGNVVARYEGATPDTAPLILASHIDSVPDAGRFDGTLGVISAIELVSHLHASGRRLPFSIEVAAFGDEEGRFPSTLGGSRMLAGAFDPAILSETDAAGISRRNAILAFGCDPTRIPEEARRITKPLGYVELHIEQGPVLEAKNLPVGVVTAVNGASRGTIEVRGMSGHAGTVPMHLRRDACSAVAEMTLAIERRARSEANLVATVGRIEIPGGAINTVPGLARFTIDVRSPSDEQRRTAVADLRRELAAIASRRDVELSITLGYDAPATPCDDRLSALLSEACREQGIAPFALPSGAGHDAMSFRGTCPIAMLFVRCRGGISHNPAEYASPEDIDIAVRTLLAFIERLAETQ